MFTSQSDRIGQNVTINKEMIKGMYRGKIALKTFSGATWPTLDTV